jgi:hypothetical protein
MTLALGACTLNSGGGNSASGAMVLEDDDGTEEGSDDTTAGGGSASTSAATAPPDETADGPMMDDGPAGEHPEVTISHDPVFDFGPTPLIVGATEPFIVTNEGDDDATALQMSVAGAFSIVEHDCGETLAAGATCEVQVLFAPELFGDTQTELQIGFEDQGAPTMVSRQILGRGVGTTRNLLINGGGELGDAIDIPPMGWVIDYGPNWSASGQAVTPYEGRRTISPGWGPPGVNDFVLHQQVDLASLTTWGDANGLQVHCRAFHRAVYSGDDPTWIELRFFDSGGGEMELHPGGLFSGITWNESQLSTPVPMGAHDTRLVLQCDRAAGDVCSGYFDGLELWAEWQG